MKYNGCFYRADNIIMEQSSQKCFRKQQLKTFLHRHTNIYGYMECYWFYTTFVASNRQFYYDNHPYGFYPKIDKLSDIVFFYCHCVLSQKFQQRGVNRVFF